MKTKVVKMDNQERNIGQGPLELEDYVGHWRISLFFDMAAFLAWWSPLANCIRLLNQANPSRTNQLLLICSDGDLYSIVFVKLYS